MEDEIAKIGEEDGKFWKLCPECGEKQVYTTKKNRNAAVKENRLCPPCGNKIVAAKNSENNARKRELAPKEEYWKTCPDCGERQIYTKKKNLQTAIRLGKVCASCAANKIDRTGEKGPFFGRHHTEESKRKARESRDPERWKTQEFRDKMSSVTKGSLNPMFGRSVYEVWVEKYGKEEADRRDTETRAKHSTNNSGSGNPMYGKPSPQGAGNGWSGWFNDHYFRSLGELNYLLKMEKENTEWVSGETIHIPYQDWEGTERTYSPDFITASEVIECKPEKLHNSPGVISKAAAGKEWAKIAGLSYLLVDPGKPSLPEMIELVNSGRMRFLESYQKKFETYVLENGLEF